MAAIVFTLDLKIANTLFKLPVLASDSLHSLTARLIQISATPAEKRTNVAHKLAQQLQRLMERTDVSAKVRAKVDSLLGSRDGEATRSPEGHFRILQESIDRAKADSHSGKHYKCLQEEHGLKAKYAQYDSNQLCYPSKKSPSRSPHRQTQTPNEDSSFIRKYEALEKKCDQYISKNITQIQLIPKRQAETSSNGNYKMGELRPSLPSQQPTTPSQIDRKFRQLNLEHLKGAAERTSLTGYSNTDRVESGRLSPLPFEGVPRRTGRRFNYLNFAHQS